MELEGNLHTEGFEAQATEVHESLVFISRGSNEDEVMISYFSKEIFTCGSFVNPVHQSDQTLPMYRQIPEDEGRQNAALCL